MDGLKLGGWGGLDRVQQQAGGPTLTKEMLPFRMTPGKVIVQRNAGYTVLAVQMNPPAQSVP